MISLRRKTFLVMSSLLAPLLVLILFFDGQMIAISRQRQRDSSFNITALNRQIRENNLQKIENLLWNFVATDASYQSLRYPTDPYSCTANVYDVSQRYSEMIRSFSDIGCIFFYSESNNITRAVYNDRYSGQYEFKMSLQSRLQQLITESDAASQLDWRFITVEGHPLLACVMGYNKLFTACAIDPSTWTLSLPDGSTVLFADANGMLCDEELAALPLSADSPKQGSFVIQDAGVRVFYEFSDYMNAYICYLMQDTGILGTLSPLSLLALAGTILLIVLIPFVLLKFNRSSLRPMEELIRTMTLIRNSGSPSKMKIDNHIREFHDLGVTFNQMIDEIQALKISAYERELAQQRTRYALLQTQIRPHFYLNCLKTIQALNFSHDRQRIETMVIQLSAFLRHLFISDEKSIPLDQEMASIQSYIAVQNISSYQPIRLNCSFPEEFRDFPIPPLSLLSFVENSVRHAREANRSLEIQIKCILLESEEARFLNICVLDNGVGFSDALLSQLNEGIYQSAPGHLGLSNAVERLRLEYGPMLSVAFSNVSPGACVDIYIPLNGSESNHDNSDRR